LAVPKRKTSKAKRDSRRANWKLKAPNVAECPNCRQPKLSHTVCPNCGQYNGEQVIEV
jgi:large subunit ribosomal protein L32